MKFFKISIILGIIALSMIISNFSGTYAQEEQKNDIQKTDEKIKKDASEEQKYDPLSWLEKWFQTASDNIPILLGSLIVGVIGSSGYYVALKIGYTGGEQREFYLRNFGGPIGIIVFIVIGGFVATIFQLAQITSFVPIQSFVLGVTWPMIVAQYVSKADRLAERDIQDLERRN